MMGKIGADLCQTTTIVCIFLRCRWGFLAQPKAEGGLFREAGKKKDTEEEERLRNLAYAAFHCSSLRVRAASTSDCVTKREPTTPDEIEGIASGIASSAMMGMI
jgi:hypothetical protein